MDRGRRQEAAPASDRKLGMHLPNGSRIEALPGSEKTVRGFSGTSLLIVDEAARVDDELYYAVRPMLAVSGGSHYADKSEILHPTFSELLFHALR